jgi:hypothetical protein
VERKTKLGAPNIRTLATDERNGWRVAPMRRLTERVLNIYSLDVYSFIYLFPWLRGINSPCCPA